jgi:uncharacterized membrane protein (DUF485 family)
VGILTAILFGLGSLLIAALGKVLSEEVHACLPLVTRWLLEKAILALPSEAREAFAKRVVGKIQGWPGKFGRFIISLWLVWESRDVLSKHIHTNLKDPNIDFQYIRRSARQAIIFSLVFFVIFPTPLILIHWEPYTATAHLMTRLLADLGVALGMIMASMMLITASVCTNLRQTLRTDHLTDCAELNGDRPGQVTRLMKYRFVRFVGN